ncbi:glutathione S-transferase 6 [Perilla frutescens var. frutescens]|nr:glutathione S-transferase 6 [Perilla frutescens var. frutescens]
MAIKLHGHPLSPAARRVLVCLAEKGLDYEFVLVDLTTGQQKKEPFISINPFGQVPGFEDGDLKLFESRAITRYIAHAYADKGTPLISEDPKKMGIIGVWLEVETQRFDAAGQKLSFEILIKPMKGMTTDDAVVEQLQAQLAGVLDVYEARLAQSKYLGGDDYSLADLHHIPIIANLQKTKVKALFDARPCVAAWAAALLARPAWQKVTAA